MLTLSEENIAIVMPTIAAKGFSLMPDSCNEASSLPFTGIAAWLLTCAVTILCLPWINAGISLPLLRVEAKISQILLSHQIPAYATLPMALQCRYSQLPEGKDKSRLILSMSFPNGSRTMKS